jgi:hypothetical protein
MPATTRSGSKQAHIDDLTETKSAVTSSKRKATSLDDAPRKRAAQPKDVQESTTDDQSLKDSHQTKDNDSDSGKSKEDILINRAPVLELWAATVTSFLYPKVSWDTSLSAGSAISTLCAISKGRSIGTIEKPDPPTGEKKRRQRSGDDKLDELEVMGFHLTLKDGHALVGEKPKKPNEAALVKKFGEIAYRQAREAFQDVLQPWSGQEEELNAQAFHHYEVFRPTVPKGQKGWGRKGILGLQTVKEAVSPD